MSEFTQLALIVSVGLIAYISAFFYTEKKERERKEQICRHLEERRARHVSEMSRDDNFNKPTTEDAEGKE